MSNQNNDHENEQKQIYQDTTNHQQKNMLKKRDLFIKVLSWINGIDRFGMAVTLNFD